MKSFEGILIFFLTLMITGIIGLFFIFFRSFNSEIIPKTGASLLSSEKNISIHSTNNSFEEREESNTRAEKLSDPPNIIKAIYLTSWSAGNSNYIDYLIDIVKTTEINAVVIDIKDFSGYIAYDAAVPEADEYHSKSIRIRDIDFLIKKLHQEKIYTIARITVFQDPIVAKKRPDLAIHSRSLTPANSSPLWFDNKNLAWIDPGAREYWDYIISISKDAAEHGFDELNYDYVRFPSDGDLGDMSFSFWDNKTEKRAMIKEFFKYIRQGLPNERLSIDLFGFSTIQNNDLGVGQIIEDSFEYFDYVCPMIYPSHYSDWFLGYQNPAEHPYEVVENSMAGALRKLDSYKQIEENKEKPAESPSDPEAQQADNGADIKAGREEKVVLRPWLQDFNLGAVYDSEMVKAEIKAVEDTAGDNFKGFMLWNSKNIYTKKALKAAH